MSVRWGSRPNDAKKALIRAKEQPVSTLVKQIVIPDDHRITIDLPPEIPVGEACITLKIEQKRKNNVGSLFGIGKGKTWMSEDFDAPLEDFEEKEARKADGRSLGKRPIGFLDGRIRIDANIKDVGGEELIRLFEDGE